MTAVPPQPDLKAKRRACLVLSGGGSNAAFQVGALEELSERYEWSAAYGVSAGALNAILVGQKRPEELRRLWLEEASGLVKRRSLLRSVWGLLFGRTGLFDNAALRRRVRAVIDEAPFQRPTFVGYVNLEDGAYQLRAHTDAYFADAAIASTSIPMVFDQPTSPSDEALADGGLRNSTPLSDAIRAGHQRVVVVSNRPETLSPSASPSGLIEVFTRTLEIVLHEISENDIRGTARVNYLLDGTAHRHDGYRRIDLSVLRPSRDLGSPLDFSEEHIREAFMQGRLDGREWRKGRAA